MRRKSLDSLGTVGTRHRHVSSHFPAQPTENGKIGRSYNNLKQFIANEARSSEFSLVSGQPQGSSHLSTNKSPVESLQCEEVEEDPVFKIKCDEERARIQYRNYITEDEQKALIKAAMLLDTPSVAREIVRNHLQHKDEEHCAFLTYQYATLRNSIISQNNMCDERHHIHDDRLFVKAIEEVERCRKRLLLKAKKELLPTASGKMHTNNQVNEFFADVLSDTANNSNKNLRRLPVSPLVVDELEKVKVKLPSIGNSPLMKHRNNYRKNDSRNAARLRFPRSDDDPVMAKELLSSKLDEFKALFHDRSGDEAPSSHGPLVSNSSKSSLFESLENEKFKKMLDLDSNELVQEGSQGSTPRSLNYLRLKAALHAGDQASSLIFDRIFTPKDKVQCL